MSFFGFRQASGRFSGAGSNGLAKVVGGEGGIRTLGTFRYTRFPVVHLRPLGHLSRDLRCAGTIRALYSGESKAPAQQADYCLGTAWALAERGGFEPPVACATLDFESSTFDHSDTSPGVTAIRANLARAKSTSVNSPARIDQWSRPIELAIEPATGSMPAAACTRCFKRRRRRGTPALAAEAD